MYEQYCNPLRLAVEAKVRISHVLVQSTSCCTNPSVTIESAVQMASKHGGLDIILMTNLMAHHLAQLKQKFDTI